MYEQWTIHHTVVLCCIDLEINNELTKIDKALSK